MRFCFIFCAFLGELPRILGRLPSFFEGGLSDFFYIDKEIIIVYSWILIKELLSLSRHQKRAL